MGTCGQSGCVFRDFFLKQGIDFNIFSKKEDFTSFVVGEKSKAMQYMHWSNTTSKQNCYCCGIHRRVNAARKWK